MCSNKAASLVHTSGSRTNCTMMMVPLVQYEYMPIGSRAAAACCTVLPTKLGSSSTRWLRKIGAQRGSVVLSPAQSTPVLWYG